MREALNSNTLFNTLAMIRAEKSAIIFVVEGDDDLFLIRRHVSKSLILLKALGGKTAAVNAARRVDQLSIQDILFLIDADYDRIVLSNQQQSHSMITSSNHDIFMDIILANEELLKRIIEAHTRQADRREGIEIQSSKIIESAMSLAASLAPIRIVNEAEDLGLKLADFPFGTFQSHRPELRDIARLAIARSNTDLSVDDILVKVERLQIEDTIHQNVLVGDHDLFRSLSRVLALNDVKGVSAETICTGFLAAVDCKHIAKTAWFDAITSWSADRGETSFGCPCAA